MKRYHQQLAQAHVRHLCTSMPAVEVPGSVRVW